MLLNSAYADHAGQQILATEWTSKETASSDPLEMLVALTGGEAHPALGERERGEIKSERERARKSARAHALEGGREKERQREGGRERERGGP